MINYRVTDLEAVLARLRQAGAKVDSNIQQEENGRFDWAVDPEGNCFELWEPKPGY
jgi:predicted enzyme related to lactoylglutathione lyase